MSHELAESILGEAISLFDVGGITTSGYDSWLIPAVTASDERDLDESYVRVTVKSTLLLALKSISDRGLRNQLIR